MPPAHWLSAGAGDCETRRYWLLEPVPPLRLESNEAYAEAFLKVFTEAVRSRLRSSGEVAAMLSGGLDSSAVTAVAARLLRQSDRGPIHTISAVSPDATTCAETRAIRSATSIEGLKPTFVSYDDFGGFRSELIEALECLRTPFGQNATILRCIYAAAKRGGFKVVLDGGTGDVILGADNRVANHLAAGKLRRAIAETRGQTSFWKPPQPRRFALSRFLSAAWVAFVPLAVRARWRQLRSSSHLPDASPDFATRVGFAKRRALADEHLRVLRPTDPAWRVQSIVHPNLVAGRERYNQLAGWFGIEPRDPFMDVRVIEFCLALPGEQLELDGWPKIVLRRVVEKLMPRDIAWRRGKEHLGWTFTTELLAGWKDWQAGICDPDTPLRHYLSEHALRAARDQTGRPPTVKRLGFFALDRFLRRYMDRPSRD